MQYMTRDTVKIYHWHPTPQWTWYHISGRVCVPYLFWKVLSNLQNSFSDKMSEIFTADTSRLKLVRGRKASQKKYWKVINYAAKWWRIGRFEDHHVIIEDNMQTNKTWRKKQLASDKRDGSDSNHIPLIADDERNPINCQQIWDSLRSLMTG